MRILAKLPAREIEGADHVLEGVLVESTSGNHCKIWPTMKAATDQTRIAFMMTWRELPTPEDTAEIMAFTNDLMGKPPTICREGPGDPWDDKEGVEWLRTGKPPNPQRAN